MRHNHQQDAWSSIVDLLSPAVDVPATHATEELPKPKKRRSLPKPGFWPFMNDARDAASAAHEIETERYYLLNGWGL